jgi:hypothetical protein
MTLKYMVVAVSRSYIWAYASFQFAVVILFAHIFYTVVSKLNFFPELFYVIFLICLMSHASFLNWQLNVNPILSVLISSVTGFGIAISTNSLLVEYLRWRASRQLQSSHQQSDRAMQQAQLLQQQQSMQTWQQENQQPRQQSIEDSNVGPIDSSRQHEAIIQNT